MGIFIIFWLLHTKEVFKTWDSVNFLRWYFNIFPRHNTQSFDDFSGSSLNFCKFNFRLSKCLDTNNGKRLEFHSLVCRKLLRDFKNFVKQTQIIEEEKGKSIRLQYGVLGDNIAILALFLRFLSRDVAW